MKKIYRYMLLTCWLLNFRQMEAMQNIIVQNKMSQDVFVESFATSGTVVFNCVKLAGEALRKNTSATIQIGIVSPTFPSKDNCAVFSLFNKSKDDYEQVTIRWGGDGTRLDGNYVAQDFYRIVQRYDDKGNTIFTFYDYDDPSLVGQLRAEVLRRLKANAASQQKQTEEIIKIQSGLKANEIEAL